MVVVVRVSYGATIPRRFGGFVQELQTLQVTILGRTLTRKLGKMIVFTLDEIFEDMEMTI